MNKAIILDRDGTINYDEGYTYKTEDFRLLPGVVKALKLLKNDFIFFVVTNQAGVGRGYYTLDEVHKFNYRMLEEFKKHRIEIKKIYICPHHPEDNCDCRKPNVKHIKEAEKEFNLDLKKSWVVGDHPYDVEMGKKAGCKAIYLLTGYGENHKKDFEEKDVKPDFVAKNIYEAAKIIIKNDQ